MNDRGFARAQWAYDNATPDEHEPCCSLCEDGEPCDCEDAAEAAAEAMAEARAEWAREDDDREVW